MTAYDNSLHLMKLEDATCLNFVLQYYCSTTQHNCNIESTLYKHQLVFPRNTMNA